MTTITRGANTIILMPCPFCFNDPVAEQDFASMQYIIACVHCDYTRRFPYRHGDLSSIQRGWNDRHPRGRVVSADVAVGPDSTALNTIAIITREDLRQMWRQMNNNGLEGPNAYQYIAWSFGYGRRALRHEFSRENLTQMGQMFEQQGGQQIEWVLDEVRVDARAAIRPQTETALQNREDEFQRYAERVAQRRAVENAPIRTAAAGTPTPDQRTVTLGAGVLHMGGPGGMQPLGNVQNLRIEVAGSGGGSNSGPEPTVRQVEESRVDGFVRRIRDAFGPRRPEPGPNQTVTNQEVSNLSPAVSSAAESLFAMGQRMGRTSLAANRLNEQLRRLADASMQGPGPGVEINFTEERTPDGVNVKVTAKMPMGRKIRLRKTEVDNAEIQEAGHRDSSRDGEEVPDRDGRESVQDRGDE